MPEDIIPGNNGSDANSGSGGVVNIDWTKVDPTDIPADVIKKTGTFGDVLTETVERRRTISELRQRLTELEAAQSKEEDKEKETPQETPTTDDPATAALLNAINSLAGRIDKLDEAEKSRARETLVASALKEHKLPAGAGEYIKGDTAEAIAASAAALAEIMGTNKAPNFGEGGGSGEANDQLASIREHIRSRIQGTHEEPHPFDPGVQRQKGGGPMTGHNPFFDFD